MLQQTDVWVQKQRKNDLFVIHYRRSTEDETQWLCTLWSYQAPSYLTTRHALTAYLAGYTASPVATSQYATRPTRGYILPMCSIRALPANPACLSRRMPLAEDVPGQRANRDKDDTSGDTI